MCDICLRQSPTKLQPRGVAVNHPALWRPGRQFESARGYNVIRAISNEMRNRLGDDKGAVGLSEAKPTKVSRIEDS